jgi:hypothetical protein
LSIFHFGLRPKIPFRRILWTGGIPHGGVSPHLRLVENIEFRLPTSKGRINQSHAGRRDAPLSLALGWAVEGTIPWLVILLRLRCWQRRRVNSMEIERHQGMQLRRAAP